MNQAFFRLIAVCCLVGVGSLCFHRFACDRSHNEEQGSRLLPTAFGEYLDEVAKSSELQPRVASNLRRILDKHEILTELLAGRLTLRTAAARFGALDADVPQARDWLKQTYPDVPYEVALCKQVIEHARAELRLRAPEKAARVVAGLEAELKALLECEAESRKP